MREPSNVQQSVSPEPNAGLAQGTAGASAGGAEPNAVDGTATPLTSLRIRLPRFLIEENENEVGFGDVIKRATRAFGVAPCGGCERRAAWLNRRVSFYR
jgi:hypothetical protein